jgi:TolA-binding protein
MQWRIPSAKEIQMKSSKFLLLVLSGSLMIYGCDQKTADPTSTNATSEDVRRDVSKAADTVTEFSQQTKEEFQNSLDLRLKEMEAEIAKLQLKGHDLKDQAKTSWDQKIAELEAKREEALAKLAEVGRSSAEAWKDVEKGAKSAWAELDKALREASSEF